MMRIYKRQHPHLSMAIVQFIAGDLLFSMWTSEYSMNLKGGVKLTCIFRKGGIRFYRKRRELIHNSGRIHLADKI